MTKKNTTQSPCPECGRPHVRTRERNTAYCSTRCRFMAKVTATTTGCWEWFGAQNGRGYGQINIDGSPVKAHRWAYQHIGGHDLDPDLVIDHLCRNRTCVNPEHLELVTNRENSIRGEAPAMITYRTGVCQRGHSMSNAIIKPGGARTCRTCENERQMRYYFARKAAVSA